ncbi:MAG TPA: ABC transporter permease [Bryobacteraceae bacterium]|nr:ABC transporter permease [Bryobacteraceae bacterium]
MTWVGRLIRRNQLEKQVDAELQFDYEQRIEDRMRAGMSEAEARRTVRLEFGDLELVKEECRDARGLQALDSLLQDVCYALRGMRRAPGFTAVAVAMLAVGIGINATVFTVTNSVLFGGFPLFERNDRIVYITSGTGCCVSWADYQDWKSQAKSFKDMALVHGVPVVLGDRDGFRESRDATLVTSNTFRLTGQRPILGRDFTPADEMPGATPAAILSYAYWERRYAKDPNVVGSTMWVNDVPAAVIGVMPRGFTFPQNQDLWMPLVASPELRKRSNRDTWFVFARLADGATIANARAEMETIGRRLGKAYPLTNQGRNLLPHVVTFQDFFIGSSAASIYRAMLGAVGFVLLIVCANLANLLLARAMGRAHEISVRMALGAGRWRIIRQLLIESTMLSGLGGILGWGIARWAIRAYAVVANGAGLSDQIFGGRWFDNVLDYSMDYRAFAYLAVISIGTGLIFGLAPAHRLSRLDVSATLKDGGRGTHGSGRARYLPGVLVIGEMALAFVLLAGAGVMIRSFLKIDTANLGFKTENLLTARIALPARAYPRPEAQAEFFDRLTTQLKALPGVDGAAICDSAPTANTSNLPYELDGGSAAGGSRPAVAVLTAGQGWFRTLGAALIAGRDFNEGDSAAAAPSAIVNQRFANANWPGENPIGKRLRVFSGDTASRWLNVVGVAPNIAQNGRTEFEPLVYVSYRQGPLRGMWVVTHSRIPPDRLITDFRRAVRSIDASLTIAVGPVSLAEDLARSYQYKGVSGALFLVFAVIALLLASIGLYAVVAHSVNRRTPEIGVRMAIGATAGDIRKLIFRRGMLPPAIGLAIGLAACIPVNRVLKSALVQVSSADPVSLAAASAALVFVAILGCVIPARRAMRVNPVAALRQE